MSITDVPILQLRDRYPKTYELWLFTPGLSIEEAHRRTGEVEGVSGGSAAPSLVADAHLTAERITQAAALDERTKAIRVAHLDLTLAEAQNVARRQLVEEGIEVPPMTGDQFAALPKVEQADVSRAIDAGELPPLDVVDEVLTASQKAMRGMDLTPGEQIEVFGPILAAQNDRHAASKLTRDRAPYADERAADLKAYIERGHTADEAEAKFPWSDYVSTPAPVKATQGLIDQMGALDPSAMGLQPVES